ncbi:hypothetical protein ACH347_16190 [Saccharopolyspora sp. 5N102]|uniref:hypothetical protein n=1 Tax=Saccharopolyspora sp. 5N102 TaxID=3375155 RepID=UPI0037A1855C
MAETKTILVTDELKTRFRRLGLAEEEIREALLILRNLKEEVWDAAGDDDETSPKIKEMFDKSDPAIRGVVERLAKLFQKTGDGGVQTSNTFNNTDDFNSGLANKFNGETGSSGGGRH